MYMFEINFHHDKFQISKLCDHSGYSVSIHPNINVRTYLIKKTLNSFPYIFQKRIYSIILTYVGTYVG